jgi:hypothetical protein
MQAQVRALNLMMVLYSLDIEYEYAADTEYLIAIKSGYIVDNQLKFAIAIEPLSSTFDADRWKDSDVFDGAFTLGTYLNLFYSGWGKMWMKDLEVFDTILTDAEINRRKH